MSDSIQIKNESVYVYIRMYISCSKESCLDTITAIGICEFDLDFI